MAKRMWKASSAKIIRENARIGTQAYRVLMKFGGPSKFHEILIESGSTLSKIRIYKWMYPRARGGGGGIIPVKAYDKIFRAAKYAGILLTSADLDPRANPDATSAHFELYRDRADKGTAHDLENE